MCRLKLDKAFFEKHLMQITLLALVGVYLYTRLPFFLKYLVPGFHVDTFTYYYPAWLMRNGLWGEIKNMPTDLPMGYPLFLALFYKLPNIWLIGIQSLLQFISSLYLLYVSFKHFGSKALFLGFLLMGYQFDSNLLSYQTNLYTESLFITFVFLFIAVLLNATMAYKRSHIIQLFLIITILILLRPNGLLFLAGPLFLLLIYGKKKSLLRFILAGYLLQILFLSSLNLGLKGYFFPVELVRYKKVILSNIDRLTGAGDQAADPLKVQKTPKKQQLAQNLKEWSTENSSFYYSRIPALIDQFEIRKQFDGFDARYPIPDHIRKDILKDIADYKVSQLEKPDLARKNYLYVIHLFNKAHTIFIKNNLMLIFFVLPAIFIVFAGIKKREMNRIQGIYLFSVFLYYVNVAFSTLGHGRFQARYVNTFDIFIYFGLFLLFVMVLNHWPLKPKEESRLKGF